MFQDSAGNKWDTNINMAIARHLDRVDFSAYTDSKLCLLKSDKQFFLEVLYQNDGLLMAYIWEIVKMQSSKNINIAYDDPTIDENARIAKNLEAENAFLTLINSGEIIEAARESLTESFVLFYPAGKTGLLNAQRANKRINSRFNTMADTIGPEIDRQVDQEMDKAIETIQKRFEDSQKLGET